MNKSLLFAPLLLLSFLSCNNDDDGDNRSQEEESANLNALFAEIQEMASSVPCNDPAGWAYTAYGDKACGGHVGYIAYPTSIDTALFLEKVEEHRSAQEAFNEKWEVISDCLLPGEPTSIRCEDGVPVFEY